MFIMISVETAAPHMGETVGVFSGVCVRQTHSRPQALESHILNISRCDFGQGCAFWSHIDTFYPMRELPSKIPHF
jgi:hypothetical protein